MSRELTDKEIERIFADNPPDQGAGRATFLANVRRAIAADRALAASSREGEARDAARLDYLQEHGATVDIIPGIEHRTWRFRIGGLHRAEHQDIRIAIDVALALAAIDRAAEAGGAR